MFHKLRFAAFAALALAALPAAAGVLHWQISPTATTDGYSSYEDIIAQYGVTDARLVAVNSSEGTYAYLNEVAGTTPGGTIIELTDVMSGTGVTSELGDYAGTAWNYLVELGYFSDGAYEVAAQSAVVSYNDLLGYISTDSLVPTSSMYAFGSFTVVPEPASGILMMIGIGLLGLKRKRPARRDA